MSTEKTGNTEEKKKETSKAAPSVAKPKPATPSNQPVQISKVKAKLHLILQATKNFEDTDPDRISLLINGEEKIAHVFDPFDNVAVVPKDTHLSSKPESIPGYFRLTLIPALKLLSEFNSNAENGLLKVGGLKDTESFYKELALALARKLDAVLPGVSGFVTKAISVNAPGTLSEFQWTIDIYVVYTYRGALVEDVIPHIETVNNLVNGVNTKGKPSKTGAIPNTGLTLSVAVGIQEAYTLATSSVDLSDYEYSTTLGESLYTPQAKTLRKTLFGANPYSPDEINPVLIFTKEVDK